MYPEQIKEKSMRGAKILLLIPLGVFLLGVVFFIVACLLEVPDKRGAIYTFFITSSLLCFIVDLFIVSVLSIMGTVLSIKNKMTGFIILGIFEILGSIGLMFIVFVIIFVTGPSV